MAGLRVEASGERVVVRQAGAEDLQVIGAHTPPIHPQAHGFVADELGGADGFVNRRGLGAGEAQLVLIDEQPAPPLLHHGGGQWRWTMAVDNGGGHQLWRRRPAAAWSREQLAVKRASHSSPTLKQGLNGSIL